MRATLKRKKTLLAVGVGVAVVIGGAGTAQAVLTGHSSGGS